VLGQTSERQQSPAAAEVLVRRDRSFTVRLPRGGGIACLGDLQNLPGEIPEQPVALLGTGDGLEDLQVVPSDLI